MKSVPAFGDYMRFLARQPEAKAERLQTHRALVLVLRGVVI